MGLTGGSGGWCCCSQSKLDHYVVANESGIRVFQFRFGGDWGSIDARGIALI